MVLYTDRIWRQSWQSKAQNSSSYKDSAGLDFVIEIPRKTPLMAVKRMERAQSVVWSIVKDSIERDDLRSGSDGLSFWLALTGVVC